MLQKFYLTPYMCLALVSFDKSHVLPSRGCSSRVNISIFLCISIPHREKLWQKWLGALVRTRFRKICSYCTCAGFSVGTASEEMWTSREGYRMVAGMLAGSWEHSQVVCRRLTLLIILHCGLCLCLCFCLPHHTPSSSWGKPVCHFIGQKMVQSQQFPTSWRHWIFPTSLLPSLQ